ncbi:MAG TPA: thioredoxin domain-containing protein [Thermoanaerobaculia bacterium]|nr:thioredoxin domain-containing protein [Thermoanaerobaculia bacterium]
MKAFFSNWTARRSASGAVLILALGVWLPACSAQDKAAAGQNAQGGNRELARVNGKVITEADVQATAKDAFAQLDRQYQQQRRELLEGTLNQAVQQRLVEAEAAAKGVTKEQLLAEVKPAPVTDADVDAFYEQNKAQIPPNMTKEAVTPRIKQYLEGQRKTEAEEGFYKQLEAKYKVDYLLEPDRVEVAATGPSKGPANAPVTIVEFSDFECPFCSRINPTLEQVRAKYGDKVRLVFRQYPLSFHQNAQKAAEASLCAHEQGKFWEMHDAMFQNQQALAVDQLKTAAAGLGLDAGKFNTCLDSGQYAAQVKADFEAGSAAGVSGTPAMFINGRFINGAVPLEQITKVIDDELKRKGVATNAP